MEQQTCLVLDFKGQYRELIARRVRECGVYSAIKPGNTPLEEIRALNPVGIILTGGPHSVYRPGAPLCSPELLRLGIPVLGICYGQQLLCHLAGGEVACARESEYGEVALQADASCPLFYGLDPGQTALMSHTDEVTRLPRGFRSAAHSPACKNAAVEDPLRKLYGVQFHPEVERTPAGTQILRNFLYRVCGARGGYGIEDFITRQTAEIRAQVGGQRVLLALSGGVDSSVCAALIAKALPGQLTCVFVDHGLMRKNEGDEIEAVFSKRELSFIRVNAQERFLRALRGVTDPEEKRKIVGREFIRVFEEEAKKLGGIPYLAQGTIYPDVVESGTEHGATIKSHHNVGGLPKNLGFTGLVEPLRGLFKDEVRVLGLLLKLPRALVSRQPFPGPGLGVRVLGEVTKQRLDLLREADAIFRQEVEKRRKRPDQYFALLTPLRSVGVMGDARTYDYTVALRAVYTHDFMTCTYAPLPHTLLSRAAKRIVNEVPGVNRVVYDITSKPPGTIEWE